METKYSSALIRNTKYFDIFNEDFLKEKDIALQPIIINDKIENYKEEKKVSRSEQKTKERSKRKSKNKQKK